MSDKQEVKIVSARTRRELGEGGKVELFSTYEYMIGELGPFTWQIETAKDSAEALRAEIDRRRAILAAVK